MKLFKTTDEKLYNLGFEKIWQNPFGARYERINEEPFTHVVALSHKKNGEHLIQSYSKDDETVPGNACVGLTYSEAKLFLRKMREIGLK